MPRLKAIGPRIAHARPRVGQQQASRVHVDRKRDSLLPWRALYKTARWQKLRRRIIARDGLMCQVTGVLLTGRHPEPNSPVVDHKTPAREFWYDGRIDMFWDESNLQTVSKAYHDSEKQRAERGGRSRCDGGVG